MIDLPDYRALEERLARERLVPTAAFRGDLKRRLLTAAQSGPVRVRRAILAYAASGGALLVAAAVSVLGVGPLAA